MIIPEEGLPLELWESLEQRLALSTFRSRFQLGESEQRYLNQHSFPEIAGQVRRVLQQRLGDAFPHNDGKQTPMKGHAIFIAQHACGCCCRQCLAKWHKIAPGHQLSDRELDYLTGVLISFFRSRKKTVPGCYLTEDLFAADKES